MNDDYLKGNGAFYTPHPIQDREDVRVPGDFITGKGDKISFSCEVKQPSGEWKTVSFPLNSVIGNVSGRLTWGQTGFAGSASNIKTWTEEKWMGLEASLEDAEYQKIEDSKIELADRFTVEDGKLVARSVPGMVGYQTGSIATKKIVDLIQKALKEDAEHKLQLVYTTPDKDGVSLFCYYLPFPQTSPCTFIKSQNADLTKQLVEVTKKSGHELDKRKPIDKLVILMNLNYAMGFNTKYDGATEQTLYPHYIAEEKGLADGGDSSIMNVKADLAGKGLRANANFLGAVPGCDFFIGKTTRLTVDGQKAEINLGSLFDWKPEVESIQKQVAEQEAKEQQNGGN